MTSDISAGGNRIIVGNYYGNTYYTFKNILEQELDSNFDDIVVIGGIDEFIEKWKVELFSKLGDLPSYSKLSKSKRKLWISSVLKNGDFLMIKGSNATKLYEVSKKFLGDTTNAL